MKPQFSAISTVFAPVCIIAALISPAIASADTATLRSISISGSGEVSAPPDQAMLTFTIRAEGETEGHAMDEASSRTAGALGELAAQGVAEELISTNGVRLQRHYGRTLMGNTNYDVIDSYTATNTIRVEVHELERVGAIIPAVVGAGANTVERVIFGLRDRTQMQDEASRRAVAEAMRMADIYAQAAGVALGQVLRISDASPYDEMGGYISVEPMMMSDMASSAPRYEVPIAPGLITVRASISMVIELVDP
ncbi:MAG: SIMPL domain-containing protein [Rhodobacteraceae bacterium]|nr:SIMPL domain-containing protein [Paracoccaceae bacterium]